MTYQELVEVMAKAPHPEAWDSYPEEVKDVIRRGMSSALSALRAQGVSLDLAEVPADITTNGFDAVAWREVGELVEWSRPVMLLGTAIDMCCHFCNSHAAAGHSPDCKLAALLGRK